MVVRHMNTMIAQTILAPGYLGISGEKLGIVILIHNLLHGICSHFALLQSHKA